MRFHLRVPGGQRVSAASSGKGRELSEVSDEAADPVCEAKATSLTPPSDTITLGLRVSRASLGDADIQFLAETSASHKTTEKSRVKGPSFENLANEISLTV